MPRDYAQPAVPLAWLPLVAGLAPVCVVVLCYVVASVAELIPSCVPLLDGCTSISASGRYGISYFLFKAGMIPVAMVQAAFWPLCRAWFLSLGQPDSRGLRAMAWLGVISAAFLILYSVFLGSKGDFYNLMRRFGVTIHFAFSYLAQVLLLNRVWPVRRELAPAVPRWVAPAMYGITLGLLLLGLYSIPVEEIIPDPEGTTINVIEWNFALLLCAWYIVIWRAWRESDFRAIFGRG